MQYAQKRYSFLFHILNMFLRVESYKRLTNTLPPPFSLYEYLFEKKKSTETIVSIKLIVTIFSEMNVYVVAFADI